MGVWRDWDGRVARFGTHRSATTDRTDAVRLRYAHTPTHV